MLRDYIAELLWLGGAAALAWRLPRAFFIVQGVALLITLALFLLERTMRAGWK